MREEIELLESLQRIDLQLQETEEKLAALPAKLQSMKDDVGTIEGLLEHERNQLANVQRYRSELDAMAQRDQAQLQKAKTKLAQIRTSKEYMAVQREFETNRRSIAERDEEIRKLDAAIEQTQQSIAQHESELEELQKVLSDEDRQIQDQMASLEATAGEVRAKRQEVAAGVGKSLLRRYDQIRRQRGGLAVAQAIDGVCTGCRMHLPPQLYNLLIRGGSIEQCQNCQRIVYFKERSGDDAADAEAAVPA